MRWERPKLEFVREGLCGCEEVMKLSQGGGGEVASLASSRVFFLRKLDGRGGVMKKVAKGVVSGKERGRKEERR